MTATLEAKHGLYPSLIVFSSLKEMSVDWPALTLPGHPPLSVEAFSPVHWVDQRGEGARAVVTLSALVGINALDRYHFHLIHQLGYKALFAVVDCMDQIEFERDQFDLISDELNELAREAGLTLTAILPAPFDHPRLEGWSGLAPVLFDTGPTPPRQLPLRLSVTSGFTDKSAWMVKGVLQSGLLRVGDQIVCSPSNQTARIAAISVDDTLVSETSKCGAVLLQFAEALLAEPQEVISHSDHAPAETDVFRVHLLWEGEPLNLGDEINCLGWAGAFSGSVQSIERTLDPARRHVGRDGPVQAGYFAEIVVRVPRLVAVDEVRAHPVCGWLSLKSPACRNSSKGFISMVGYADQRRLRAPKSGNLTPVDHAVTAPERDARNGHQGGVLWFTGLSGAGKSTLAFALEKALFEKGYQVFVLDGDNVRQGLAANLGFSPDDRAENIRRVGEVAALFREAGIIVISSFISPYRSDRDRARHAAHTGFHEIYIEAGIKTCITRDPKGLYKRALKGDIREFTGISAPYEPPSQPELTINTEKLGVKACLELLVHYAETQFRL